MAERRFALVDFTYTGKTGRARLHEAGHTYALPRAVAHAATKRELVAKKTATALDATGHLPPARGSYRNGVDRSRSRIKDPATSRPRGG